MGASYAVTAENPDADSENRIHSDDVARAYGFRGGLVPGAVVYRYACPAVVVALGQEWPARGTADVRFLRPVYEGERIRVSSQVSAAATASVNVENEAGELCATVEAEVPSVALAAPDAAGYAATPPPATRERPPATPKTVLPGTDLGAISATLDADSAHPAEILRLANRLLVASFRVSPWIHAGSRVRHLAELVPGDAVEVRGRIATTFERKGHRFLELDVLALANGRPCALVAHTAIYQLAEDRANA